MMCWLRRGLVLTSLAVGMGALALPAQGQTIPPTTTTTSGAVGIVQKISINGEELENITARVVVNAQHCEEGGDIVFTLNPSTANLVGKRLEVWRSAGDQPCNTTDARADGDGNPPDCVNGSTCSLRGSSTITNASQVTASLALHDLMATDLSSPSCPATGRIRVTFVAVNNEGMCQSPEADLFGMQQAHAVIELDTDPPSQPTDLSAKNGDSEIRASWKHEGGQTEDRFTVFIDSQPGANCADSAFAATGDAGSASVPTVDDTRIHSRTSNNESLSINPESLGVADGDFVAIAVITEDENGNVGALSSSVCAQRIQTSGLLDSTGDDVVNCHAGHGHSRGRIPAGALALAMLGLLGWRRSSRRRSSW